MDDDLALDAVDEVAFLPREVVVVFHAGTHGRAELARDVTVDKRMVSSGVAAHEFHGGPVFLTGFLGELQPREVGEFLR